MILSKQKQGQVGFTLIELLITLAIIGIIAAIAIPSYLNYTRRAHFSELVKATAPFKLGVAVCAQELGTITGCDAGRDGVPAALGSINGTGIASLGVADGVITVTPKVQNGLVATDTYILTPILDASGTVTWASSGGGVTAGYAK